MELTNDTTVSVNPFDALASWEFLRHILSDVLPKTWIPLSGVVYVIAEVLAWTFAKRSLFLEFMKWICYVGVAKAPKLNSVTENVEQSKGVLECEFSKQHSCLSRIFPLIEAGAVVYLTNHNLELSGDWQLEGTNYNCHLNLAHLRTLPCEDTTCTIRARAKYGNILFGSREEAQVFSPQSNEIQHFFLCNLQPPDVKVKEELGVRFIKWKIPREADKRLFTKVTRCIAKSNQKPTQEKIHTRSPNTNKDCSITDESLISKGMVVTYKVGLYSDRNKLVQENSSEGITADVHARIEPEMHSSNGIKPRATNVLNNHANNHPRRLRPINSDERSVQEFRDCEIVMKVICQTYEAFTELREMCSDGRVSETLSNIVASDDSMKSFNVPDLKLHAYMKYSSYLDTRKNFARAACGSMPQLEVKRHAIVAGTVVEWSFATQDPYLQWRHLHCKVQRCMPNEPERGQWIDVVFYKPGEMDDSDTQIYFDHSRSQCCSYRIGVSFDGEMWDFSNFTGGEVEVQVSMSGTDANVDYLKPVLNDIIDISRLEKRNLCSRGDNISTAIDCLEDGARYVEDVCIENSNIILTVVCASEKSMEEVVDLCCRGIVANELCGTLEREEDIDLTVGGTLGRGEDIKLTVKAVKKLRKTPEFIRNVIIKTIPASRLHEALYLETGVPKKIGRNEREFVRSVVIKTMPACRLHEALYLETGVPKKIEKIENVPPKTAIPYKRSRSRSSRRASSAREASSSAPPASASRIPFSSSAPSSSAPSSPSALDTPSPSTSAGAPSSTAPADIQQGLGVVTRLTKKINRKAAPTEGPTAYSPLFSASSSADSDEDREVQASKFRSESYADFPKPIVPAITDDEQYFLQPSDKKKRYMYSYDVILLLDSHDKDFVEKQVKPILETNELRCLLRTESDKGKKLEEACQRLVIVYSDHAPGNNSWKQFLMEALETKQQILFLLVDVEPKRAPLVVMEFNYITTTRPLWKKDLVHFATSGSTTSITWGTIFDNWIYHDLCEALHALQKYMSAEKQRQRLRMRLAASSNKISLVCSIDDKRRTKQICDQLIMRGVKCSDIYMVDETKDTLSFSSRQPYCVVLFLPERSEQFKRLVERDLNCIHVVLDYEWSLYALHKISLQTESYLVPDKDFIASLIQAITGFMPPIVYLAHLRKYCKKLLDKSYKNREKVREMRQVIRSIRMYNERYKEPCLEKERSQNFMPPGSAEDVLKRLSECLFVPDWYEYLK